MIVILLSANDGSTLKPGAKTKKEISQMMEIKQH